MPGPYKGRSMLLKVGNGASPTSFTTLAGLQSRSVAINNEQVDITNDDTAPLREILQGAGQKTVSISANGICKDDAAFQAIELLAWNTADTVEDFQIVLPNGKTIQGAFHVAAFEYGAEYNGAQTFSITLENAGTVVLSG